MFYPWSLNDRSGALDVLLRYSKALKDAGYRLDCFAPSGVWSSTSADPGYGIFENVFVMPQRESPMTRILEFAGAQWDDPLLAEKLGRDDASMAAAAVIASSADYDVVGIHYTRCHSLKQMLPPGLPVAMFTHDLDSLVCRQEETIFGIPAEYSLIDEAARLKPFDLVTVVGPDDRKALHSIDPNLPIVEAPFTAALQEAMPVREHSPGVLLWISSAASFHRLSFFWFWKNIWPKIRSARPACQLIIGGRISEVAGELGAANDPQVSVLGVVHDADDLYRQADILIAPYYFGLGIKTKVIEALAKGIPVVTTGPGISNTQLRPGRDLIVSNDAGEYAAEVVNLISSPEIRKTLARNGREYVRRHHAPETALQSLIDGFERIRIRKKQASRSRANVLRDLYEPLRHLLPWTIQRCRTEKVRNVAIYGAGSHTRLLIPLWQALGGPPIRNLIVTGEPSEAIFMAVQVVSANRFDPSTVDAIVLSSQGYEQEMAVTCAERWPKTSVYRVWRPVLEEPSFHLSEDFGGVCNETIPASLCELV
jgi:hypothetical protein